MINTKKAIFVMAIIFFTNSINAQSDFSIQLNSGISDISSSLTGFSGQLQLNYSLNPDLDLYLYSGYSNVERHNNNRLSHHDLNLANSRNHSGLIMGDNNVIPIYFGGSLDLFENEWITTFANLELGYSYLSFNTYERMLPIHSDNGELIRYRPDRSTRENHSENLFGTGIGVGASHEITNGLEVLLTLKLNTNTNFDRMKMFSRPSTYTSLLAGINYRL